LAIALNYAARSDIGLGRYKNNQDSGYAGPHLLVVCDGMGGNAGGDVASSLTVGRLAGLDGEAHGSNALQRLEQKIREAASTVRERACEQPELEGMATTVTALLRSGDRLALAHVGDSRAYLLHDGDLTQVTTDHTFVQRLVDEGRITAEEADRHPQRNVVTRMLGDLGTSDDIDSSMRSAGAGDRWLLCSDGLSGFISKDTLAETLASVPDPGACADRLVQLALRGGGADNITCIVADVVEVSTAPTTTPQVVGAAASDRGRPTVAHESAASKAAALSPASDQEDDAGYTDEEEPAPGRARTIRRALGGLLLLAILAGGLYGAWVWSQSRYYVGADGDQVAIYRGLDADVGQISMSRLHERQDLQVETLTEVNQGNVRSGIGADDLADAEQIVANLYRSSSECEPEVVTVTPRPTPSPTPAPTDSATAAVPGGTTTAPGTALPTSPTVAATPTPSRSTLPLPSECGT